MPNRRRTNVYTYDCDASFTAELESDDYNNDVFVRRSRNVARAPTQTDIGDLCDDDLDVEDQIRLFDGNIQSTDPGTTVLLDAVEEQWRQYMRAKETRNQEEELFGTYWKVFRLFFERAVLRDLGKEHRLIEQRRDNRCITIDNLKQRIRATLSTTNKSLKLGELRILAVLFVLLLAPAGSRPEATLNLRFKDIRVVLARDPEGGPHKLPSALLWSSPKAILVRRNIEKTYSIPETMFDPFLLLILHVFLLSVLFQHRAFNACSLTSPHHLDNLDIRPGERELPLPSREDLNDIFIFRRAIETLTGYQISTNDRITSEMMAAWIQRIGEILGIEYPTIAYNLRYNAANAFDQSVDVSEALRNLALGHGNSDPFQRHYLGRNILADLWGVLRGQKPQQALKKQSCSIGLSISEQLPQGSKQYNKVNRARQNEKPRLRRELKQEIRDEWTDKQATDDIERQIHGIGFANPATDNTCRPQGPAQRHLMTKLTAPIVTTLEGQYRRRDEAIEAVSAYYLVQEGCTAAVRYSTSDPPEGGQLDLATRSVFITNDQEWLKRYFVYISRALDLPPDNGGQLDNLTLEFYTYNNLTKHFRHKYLSKIADGNERSARFIK
ncbi:hypothetical protein BDP81DRAFT_460869 [Colletotrichum phormii]|uniref:Uncharacterized protein n=1 Tax=Colletotrichum phormii TaxID=359342 RepID=A0AAJ0EFT3_9PEZI|nr:uncharacterized protein BDP81DRAFT_460869 [Colletotrichum phormii]KAK1637329.1 hypothetical protein BDP81DRAFT_460869 [Colletotrichum phormii]